MHFLMKVKRWCSNFLAELGEHSIIELLNWVQIIWSQECPNPASFDGIADFMTMEIVKIQLLGDLDIYSIYSAEYLIRCFIL